MRGTKFVLLAGLFVFTVQARDEYTRSFDHTVAVKQGAAISIEHKLGDVVIRTHATPEVVVHADIKASGADTSEAKTLAESIQIAIEPSSSGVSIKTVYPESSSFFSGHRSVSYTVRYEVVVPEWAALEVRNAFGSVSVSDLSANATVMISHGSIEWRNGKGTERLEASFGSVHVSKNVGDVSVEASYGGVDASDIDGSLNVRDQFAGVNIQHVSKGVTVVNRNGSIQIGDSGGTGDVQSSFGNVTVSGFRGNLTVNGTHGRIDAQRVEGTAELNTSFGQVSFADIQKSLSIRARYAKVSGERVGGAITIENSFGPVNVSLLGPAVCQPIDIRTSFSAIRMLLGGEVSYRVAAKTSYGTIRTDFPLTVAGPFSSDQLSGTIGSGRCEMTLRNEHGAIEIVKGG